jgi:hypothetical protein
MNRTGRPPPPSQLANSVPRATPGGEPGFEDVIIAEAKLSAAQKTEFTSKYYDALAQPVIEEQRQQKARVYSLLR